MNKKEKAQFVRDLTRHIRDDVLDSIAKNQVPAEWDGHELRELLFDKFRRERSGMLHDRRNIRARNYVNDVIVNNL